ncbi:MAG: PEGA domain-containing protein [Candidatus Woesearchaeota archaeon]
MKRIITLTGFFLGLLLLTGSAFALNEYTINGINAFSTYYITSSPSITQIYIDDKYIGDTPAKIIGLNTGEHTITLKAQGYRDYSKILKIEKGQSGKILAALTSESGVVSKKTWPVLKINCNVECNVYVNNALSYEDSMDLDFGTYNIKILPNDKDHHSYNAVLDLTKPETYEFNTYLATFEEHYSYENRLILTVNSNPSEAEVFIDGKNYGKTPLGIASLSLDNHNLTIKKEGYLTHDQVIKKTNGKGTRYNTLTIDLMKGEDPAVPQEEDDETPEEWDVSKPGEEPKTPSEIAAKYINIENTVQTNDTYIFTGTKEGRLWGLFKAKYEMKIYVYKDGTVKKEGPWYDSMVIG